MKYILWCIYLNALFIGASDDGKAQAKIEKLFRSIEKEGKKHKKRSSIDRKSSKKIKKLIKEPNKLYEGPTLADIMDYWIKQ